MSKERISQELFMRVKEKLDYYHLPTTFPFEAAPLLNKLISLVENQGSDPKSKNKSKSKSDRQSFDSNSLDNALKHQMAKIVKQNNKLHMDVICAMEQIQSLSHNIDKIRINSHSGKGELEKLIELKQLREVQLIQELRDARFKYNQIMDFLHEDSEMERQYIKRLMKHNKMEDAAVVADKKQKSQSKIHLKSETHYEHFKQKVKELQFKLGNRQTQIKRLQNLVEYDGLNMNKIIKDFNADLIKKKFNAADSKINYLEQSYQKVKKQNLNMKNKNGLKEALRSEVKKSHQIIQNLKTENQKLRRNAKQQEFDLYKKASEMERESAKNKQKRQQAEYLNKSADLAINNLMSRIAFMEKQIGQYRVELNKEKGLKEGRENELGNLDKKYQDTKLYYEYELDNLKKKLAEMVQDGNILNEQYKASVDENFRCRKQGNLKTLAIQNLEKIVDELMRKNSILAQSTGILDHSFKRHDEVEARRLVTDLRQQVIHLQNERDQIEMNLLTAQNRLNIYIKENEKLRQEVLSLNNGLNSRETSIAGLSNDVDQLKHLLKKEEIEHLRDTSQLAEVNRYKDSLLHQLKQDNERLSANEKQIRHRLRQLEIKNSQQQGLLQINKLRIEDKQNRNKHLEDLLAQANVHIKKLSHEINQLDQRNHEISRDKHRLQRKYDQMIKQSDINKSSSMKNFESAFTDSLNQANSLKREVVRLNESNDRITIRYEEINTLLNFVRREKELIEVDKISFERQNEHLRVRLLQMQDIERTLVIENQSIRNYSRRM